MSASVEELRGNLRQRAVQKRTLAFENATKPQDLAGVLSELTDVLKAMQALLAAQGNPKFEVLERELNGQVKSFKVVT